MKKINSKLLKTSFLATLPVMAGYVVLGIGFGMILKSKGLGIAWSLAMSLFIYAGSLQFVLIDLITGGASLLSVGLTSLAVNARHFMYGLSMVDKYRSSGKRKPYLVFALTDETFALVCRGAPENVDELGYYFFVSLFNQAWWIIGSALGTLAGTALHFNSKGIDFALTALFVSVFVEQWLESRQHLPAIIGIVISVLFLLLVGPDSFLIPSMIAMIVFLLLMRKPIEKGEKSE